MAADCQSNKLDARKDDSQSQTTGSLIRVGEYPPGVEFRGRELNTEAVFLPVGRVELGGCELNRQDAEAREERALTLAEEVLPRLPKEAPPRKRGKARVLTPEVLEEFCLLVSVGLSRRQAAARLGLEHSTISRAAGQDGELAADLRRAEEMANSEPMLCLIAASRKHWRAALSLMKYKRDYPPRLDQEEKEERQRERKEDARRDMEYSQYMDALKEQEQVQKEQREEAKRDAKEEAWQERERVMIKKEREEQAEKKKRRTEREAAAAAGTS